ncbi:MAG: zf-HC2 domain-containing protein [Bryobacteraceae bacterium]
MASQHDENCRGVFALLSDYLDLELPADACAEVEAHLADCPPCVEFAESLRKTVELCRNYQPDELPAPLGEQARDELLEAYQKMLAGRRTA